MKTEHSKIKSLFGLEKDFLLKNQLLQLLDNSSDYITFTEIACHLKYYSVDISD